MSRQFTPKVVTANDLHHGDVIYFTSIGTWTREHGEAELLDDEAHAQIRLIEASQRSAEAVGVYLADARPGPNGPEPVHFREVFRSRGPSNYPHGKQADRTAQA